MTDIPVLSGSEAMALVRATRATRLAEISALRSQQIETFKASCDIDELVSSIISLKGTIDFIERLLSAYQHFWQDGLEEVDADVVRTIVSHINEAITP